MAKRKAAEPSQEEEEEPVQETKPAKKTKAPKEAVQPIDSSLPTNTAFPESLQFEPPKEGDVRISCWNVCGINACQKKGLEKYIAAENADVIFLSETKSVDPKFANLNSRYAHRYWGVDPNKKGYAGVALLSKIEPMKVTFGLPTTIAPQVYSAGRLITAEFENCYVVGTYVPNAGEKLKTMPEKEAWNKAFEVYLRQLDEKKPVIWTGDINCVSTEADIRNWKTNHNKSAGCTDIEIAGLNSQLNPPPESGHKKLTDVWRHLHPDAIGYYTYFSYRFQCRVKGIGWRLDTFILSDRLLPKVTNCDIRLEVFGASDHVPVILDIAGPL